MTTQQLPDVAVRSYQHLHACSVLVRVRILLALLLVVTLPPPVYAHPDLQIVDDSMEVKQGGFVAFPLSVHYHRVVGHLQVTQPADGRVRVLVVNDLDFAKYAAREAAPPAYSSGNAGGGTLNYLIACCSDQQWTAYHLIVENPDSSAPATVRSKVWLIHDGLAVLAYGEEDFVSLFPTGAPFTAFAVIIGLFTLRTVRRTRASVPATPMRGTAVFILLGSLALFAAPTVTGVSFAILGTRTYGGSLIDGLETIRADIPSPDSVALVIVLSFFAWLLWMMAFRFAATGGSRLAGPIGVIEGGAALLFSFLWAWNYGFLVLVATLDGGFMLLAITGIFALPQVLGGLYLTRRLRSSLGPGESPR